VEAITPEKDVLCQQSEQGKKSQTTPDKAVSDMSNQLSNAHSDRHRAS
jgi:hypothetical protein